MQTTLIKVSSRASSIHWMIFIIIKLSNMITGDIRKSLRAKPKSLLREEEGF